MEGIWDAAAQLVLVEAKPPVGELPPRVHAGRHELGERLFVGGAQAKVAAAAPELAEARTLTAQNLTKGSAAVVTAIRRHRAAGTDGASTPPPTLRTPPPPAHRNRSWC